MAMVLVIASLTLTPGGTKPADHFELCITCGTYWASDFGLNVLLFIPLGFGLRLSGMRRATAWGIALAATCGIEALQYHVIPGRESDLSDIVSNSLGAALGVGLADARRLVLAPPASTAARMAAGGAVLLCTAAAVIQWALSVSLPESIYYEQVAPSLGQFARFDGQVFNASLNGAPFRVGRLSADASSAMRNALAGGNAHVTAVVFWGTPRRRLAPILSVFDHERREIFVLGQRRHDLVFRIRRRSDDWGFHAPSLTLDNALSLQAGPADSVRIDATATDGALRISAESQSGLRSRRLDSGIWQAWTLLLSDDGRYGDHATPITMLWVAAMFAPLAYWGRRGEARTGPLLAATPTILTMVVALAIIPWVAGSPPAPWPIWAAAGGGAALAWAAAWWLEPMMDPNP
jgi:VanZ like family